MKRNFLFAAFIGTLFLVSLNSFLPADNANLVSNVLKQTNQFRKSEGMPELQMNKELNHIAQNHSKDMAAGRIAFGHDGFGGRQAKAAKEIKGMHTFAENVAYGANSAAEVVTMWKNSPGHRRNMLGNFQYIGIGTAKNSKGQIYYTEIFAD